MYGREAIIELPDDLSLTERLEKLAALSEGLGDKLLLRYDDLGKCRLIALAPDTWNQLVIRLRDAQADGQIEVVQPDDIDGMARALEELWRENA